MQRRLQPQEQPPGAEKRRAVLLVLCARVRGRSGDPCSSSQPCRRVRPFARQCQMGRFAAHRQEYTLSPTRPLSLHTHACTRTCSSRRTRERCAARPRGARGHRPSPHGDLDLAGRRREARVAHVLHGAWRLACGNLARWVARSHCRALKPASPFPLPFPHPTALRGGACSQMCMLAPEQRAQVAKAHPAACLCLFPFPFPLVWAQHTCTAYCSRVRRFRRPIVPPASTTLP
jgi:hypothetical protein